MPTIPTLGHNKHLNLKFISCLSVALGLCACQPSASPPPNASSTASATNASPSISLEKMSKAERDALIAQLMRTAFAEKYNAKLGGARVDLRNHEKGSARSLYELSHTDIFLLPDQQILLVANAQGVEDNGEIVVSHASSGLLNLLWFGAGEKPGTWKVNKRAENIAMLGSHGMFGRAQLSTFADKQSMLTVESGGTWQGYTVSQLNLFHITNQAAQGLGSVLIHSDSEGGCVEETEHCWNISAAWKFVASQAGNLPDLQLTISGVDENMPEDSTGGATGGPAGREERQPATRLSQNVTGSARYGVKDGKYVLIQGENIVPSL